MDDEQLHRELEAGGLLRPQGTDDDGEVLRWHITRKGVAWAEVLNFWNCLRELPPELRATLNTAPRR